jgi:hypothetical protein
VVRRYGKLGTAGLALCVLGLAGCAKHENPPGGTPAPVGTAGPAGQGMAGSAGSSTGSSGAGSVAMASASGSGGAAGQAPMGSGQGGSQGSAGSGGAAGNEPPPPPADANSWRMMGYDASNTYFNPAEKTISVANAPTLVEKWRKTVAGFPPGSPVIAEGKVFVMATGGSYAFDLETGTQLWARMDIAGTASAAYDAGFVYFHSGAEANVWKVKAIDGTTVWGPVKSYELSQCDGTSSPTVGGGKVIVGHSCGLREIGGGYAEARGGVEAFDVETGTRAWTYWTTKPEGTEDGAMVWSTVAIDVASATVYATTGNNYSVAGPNSDSIHAIDLGSGAGKWMKQVRMNDVWSLLAATLGEDTDFGANPILATIGGKQVVAAGDKGSVFWQLDRTTGTVNWSRDNLSASHNQANGGVLNNGAFDGQHFYAVSNGPAAGNCMLHKMDGATGVDAWVKTYPKITWGAPSLANGVLFVPINDDLYVLNAADGAVLKMFATGGTIAAGAAAVAQGRIVVGSGMQYAFAGASAINNNEVICYGLP